MVNSKMKNTWFHSDNLGLVQFIGMDNMGCSIEFFVR